VPVAGDRVWFIWLTAYYAEPVDHAVTDEEMAAGRGEYRAVCDVVFLPAAMESPPKPVCPACLKALQSRMDRAANRSAGAAGCGSATSPPPDAARPAASPIPSREGLING
jgi:hypothetical protein